MYVLRFNKNVTTWVTHVYLRKGKKEQKNKSTHINSNSITYMNRSTSITDKRTTIYKYIHVHIHKIEIQINTHTLKIPPPS